MRNWLNTTHLGDCRDLLCQMLNDGIRVQTCITSPPYFGLRDYGVAGQIGREPTLIEYVENLVTVFRTIRNILTDDGTLWLNLGDSYASSSPKNRSQSTFINAHKKATDVCYEDWNVKPKNLLGVPWRVALALQADGWYLRSDIIWHKPNPMPESIADRPTKAHEYLFLLAKQDRYYYDAEAIMEKGSGRSAGNRTYKYAGLPGYETKQGILSVANKVWDKRNRRSVWTVPSQPFAGAHFATFPSALVEPCVLAGSRPGDTVLDPFMGSGTTAQVASLLGRQFIGCEINPEYIALQNIRCTTVEVPK